MLCYKLSYMKHFNIYEKNRKYVLLVFTYANK